MKKNTESKKPETSKKEGLEPRLPDNDERVARVDSILPEGDPQTGVVDLLADIMHFCGRNGLRFPLLLDVARTHFIHELDDELTGSFAELFMYQELFAVKSTDNLSSEKLTLRGALLRN